MTFSQKRRRIRCGIYLVVLICLLGCLSACSSPHKGEEQPHKPLIVATLFPQYDFARQIVGDQMEVELLLPPGVESHSFEPTPADMIRINEADLLLYTGAAMEPWAQEIVASLDPSVTVLDLSQKVPLAQPVHENEGEEEHEAHAGQPDPHFWTDPTLAAVAVGEIADAVCEIDPAHADLYRANQAAYEGQLQQLDQKFQEIVAQGQRRELIFGGRFALYYFVQRYGLTYQAAYDSCSSQAEPSARRVAELIDEIKAQKIPVIYYEELSDPKVARDISAETGATMLLFHSCHNVSKEEWEQGVTYLQLMEQNAVNLAEGLKG